MGDTPGVEQLNDVLADATVLWFALHDDHWNVTGQPFFALHQKFEEMYTAWGEHLDAIAERVLALDGRPLGSLGAALERSAVQERAEGVSTEGRVKALIENLTRVHERMGAALQSAEDTGDRGTVNLLDAIRDEIEKDRWMLRAFVG